MPAADCAPAQRWDVSDDSLNPTDMALLYKSLLEVERSWQDLKQVIALRPIYHRK